MSLSRNKSTTDDRNELLIKSIQMSLNKLETAIQNKLNQ